MIICGIDEAGRGPIIGALVLAGVTLDEKDLPKLKDFGIKDSKLLTEKKRDFLFEKVKEIVKEYKIIIVEPQEIDDAVFGKNNLNLNKLEAIKTAEIINELKPDKAILDSPSNNIKSYKQYLSQHVKTKSELVPEHKADLNHEIVGAASILAKVTRDRSIEKLKQEIGTDFGSGYPSDPKTQEFLKENYEKYSHLLRKSWSTYQDLVSKKHQTSLGDF